jgi:hypothetical protein
MTSNSAGDNRSNESNVRRLSDAVRRIRVAEAERADAFVDLHEADRARLGLVAEELAGVFAELPETDDYFICELAGSTPPRLWIDPTSHVSIGRDRRSYRFLKDTRLGRVVLMESSDPQAIADAVTDYIAERLVDRERAEESDYLMSRLRLAALPARRGGRRAGDKPLLADGERGATSWLWSSVLFLAGFTVGALGLVAYAWFVVGH